MAQKKSLQFSTWGILSSQTPQDWDGATIAPIYQIAPHSHSTTENLNQALDQLSV